MASLSASTLRRSEWTMAISPSLTSSARIPLRIAPPISQCQFDMSSHGLPLSAHAYGLQGIACQLLPHVVRVCEKPCGFLDQAFALVIFTHHLEPAHVGIHLLDAQVIHE